MEKHRTFNGKRGDIMIFIGDKDEIILRSQCKNIKEFSEKINYHSHYLSEVFRGKKKCSRQLALAIAEIANLPLNILFKEEQ